MPTYWIQIENHPWDTVPSNIDRIVVTFDFQTDVHTVTRDSTIGGAAPMRSTTAAAHWTASQRLRSGRSR